VVNGRPTVNPDRVGTKAALHYVLTVAPGETRTVRLRLALVATPADEWSPQAAARNHAHLDLRKGFDSVFAARKREADEFFASVIPPDASVDEGMVLRQAVAGLMWSKQFYHWDVARWLA